MPGRHDCTPQALSANLFDGDFHDSWHATGQSHGKVVEAAKTKESGTSARARGKRGGATGAHNKETFNFQLGPTDASSPTRKYKYKPERRDVVGGVEGLSVDSVRPGKKFTPPVVPKDAPRTHKRMTATTNVSEGASTALVHEATAEPPASPTAGKRTDMPSPRGNIGRGWNPRPDSTVYKHANKRRAVREAPGLTTQPWAHGGTEMSPKRIGRRPHSGGYQKHSFEPEPREPRFPGYKIQAPFDTE